LNYEAISKKLRPFSEEFALPFPVLLDEDGKVTDELYPYVL